LDFEFKRCSTFRLYGSKATPRVRPREGGQLIPILRGKVRGKDLQYIKSLRLRAFLISENTGLCLEFKDKKENFMKIRNLNPEKQKGERSFTQNF
jgi:hypothetical protein